MSSTQLPLEYLATSSENCLEAFELARLNQISNLRKEFSQVFDEWVEAEIAARMARWVLAGRRGQRDGLPFARLASTEESSREMPVPASDLQHARLRGAATKSRRNCDSRNSPASGNHTFLQAGLFDESNREFHTRPLDRKSGQSPPNRAIALDACAALEILENLTARELRRFPCGRARSKESRRKSANRSSMLPFPEVHCAGASAELVAQTVFEAPPALEPPRDESKTVAGRKVLSLPSVRRNHCTGFGRSREDACRLVARDGSSRRDPRGVVRQFPRVRAAREKPLVYGNVALSRF